MITTRYVVEILQMFVKTYRQAGIVKEGLSRPQVVIVFNNQRLSVSLRGSGKAPTRSALGLRAAILAPSRRVSPEDAEAAIRLGDVNLDFGHHLASFILRSLHFLLNGKDDVHPSSVH